MSTRTFHAELGAPLDGNWIASRRLVNPFAPHESAVPDMRVVLDPGHLLVAGQLVEVGAQAVSIAPLTAPPTAFRIDRICIKRATGEALALQGPLGQHAPPNVPADCYPVARLRVTGGAPAITNEVIVDERSLSQSPASEVTCRLTLAQPQPIAPAAQTPTRINFTSAPIDVGGSFSAGGFKPTTPGRYSVSARTAMRVPAGEWRLLRAFLYVGGEQRSVLNTYLRNRSSSNEVFVTLQISDIFELDGTEIVELYASHAEQLTAAEAVIHEGTVMMAHRLG